MVEHDDLHIRNLVDQARLQALYRSTPLNILATLVVMGAFVWVMGQRTPMTPLLIWYGLLVAVLLVRFFNYLQFRRLFSHRNGDDRRWWVRHRLGVFFTGLVLGSSTFVNFEHLPQAYQIFSVFVLAGLSAAALTVMILDKLSYTLYLTTLMVPPGLLFITFDDPLHLAISLMVAVYIVVLLKTSKGLHDKVVSSMVLGHENGLLAEHLAREKQRLDSRLGRILNDSSNEIYVFDAHNLRCMQVNQGALQHLGYLEEEIVNLTLTEIVCDLAEEDVRRLMQPLRDGQEESVFYHGYHQRKDGSRYPVEIRLQYSDNEDPPVIVATALDMSERDKVRHQLIHQANFDQLTDLPNRFSMLTRVEQAFYQARRTNRQVALLFLDLDDFKKVNDALGHAAGDLLLQKAADRIRSTIRESDTASRLGGDEFMIMLEGLNHRDQAIRVAHKLIEAFKRPFDIGGSEIYTNASIGISLFPHDGVSVEELMQYADIAMYRAKQRGGGQLLCFDHRMLEALEEKLELEGALRRAISENEFTLLYQPKVDALSGRILGAEALLRWHNRSFGHVSPARFIPLAENLGLIHDIGAWVLKTACQEAAQWQELTSHPLRVAVNVSPQQFRSGKLIEDVTDALVESRLPANRLELEITESLLLHDCSDPLTTLQKLRRRGIHLSLDDFGTGYSSLAYLRRFPLQVLKIDRSFIRDMTEDDNARALVEAIISMSRSLELDIVAEGVENWQQLKFLHKRGVRVIQGYYFSPPVKAEEFRALLDQCARGAPRFHALSRKGCQSC